MIFRSTEQHNAYFRGNTIPFEVRHKKKRNATLARRRLRKARAEKKRLKNLLTLKYILSLFKYG